MRRYGFLWLFTILLAVAALACGDDGGGAFTPPTDSIGVLKVNQGDPIKEVAPEI